MRKSISSPLPAKAAPQRTCAACRKVKNKKEMVRLVRSAGGTIEIDLTGKKDGRGAYLCRDRSCWEGLSRGKQLEHAFRQEINRGDLDTLMKNGKDLLKE